MTERAVTEEISEDTIGDRVQEFVTTNGRIFALEFPVKDVVSLQGSLHTMPNFMDGDELLQEVMVELLDKGTMNRDRFELADVLEQRGAEVDFYSDGLRVEFRVKALRRDVKDVLAIVREQLEEPRFDESEFVKARAQIGASIRRSMESTGSMASSTLRRLMFDPGHPNYSFEAEAELARLEQLGVDDVRKYHKDRVGANGFVTVVVGDGAAQAAGIVEDCFEGWPVIEGKATFMASSPRRTPEDRVVPMPDKRNLDVYLGHAVEIRRNQPDFVPLYAGNYILGGNFSARLMRTVRDEQGLTYGVGSSLRGVSVDYNPFWQVQITLSQANLEKGIEATRSVVREFVENGITEDELAVKRETIAGSYRVGLATTGGLASTLLANAERGFETDYVDRFVDEVRGLTLAQVNAAISRYLDVDRLNTVIAGTLPE